MHPTPIRALFRAALLVTLALTTAHAQGGGPAQGTWDTNYGELRLTESAGTINGEFDRGIIYGRAYPSGPGIVVRGIYHYANADASQLTPGEWGTVNLHIADGLLVGPWTHRTVPQGDPLERGDEPWAGVRRSSERPVLQSQARFTSRWTPDQSEAAPLMAWVRNEPAGTPPRPPYQPREEEEPLLRPPGIVDVTIIGFRTGSRTRDGVATSGAIELFGDIDVEAMLTDGPVRSVDNVGGESSRVWSRSRPNALRIEAPRRAGSARVPLAGKEVDVEINQTRRFAVPTEARLEGVVMSVRVRSDLTERDGRANGNGRLDDDLGDESDVVRLLDLPLWSTHDEYVGEVSHDVPGTLWDSIEVIYTIRRVQ